MHLSRNVEIMTWFAALTGFSERDVGDVAAQFIVDGDMLESRVNGRRMQFGRFETPTLAELRTRLPHSPQPAGRLQLREVVGDAQYFHADPANACAVFQVASQFNTLEMVGPSVTPEHGIDGYETDRTQGPACAIACGAGTIFRNYLVPLDDHVGQSAARQINCLADVAHALGEDIPMRNGYALPNPDQLQRIESTLAGLTDSDRDALMLNCG